MASKKYEVYYIIKMNGTERLHMMQIEAANAKEACKSCKDHVLKVTGRNAFRPTTRMSENEINRYYNGEVIRHIPTSKI